MRWMHIFFFTLTGFLIGIILSLSSIPAPILPAEGLLIPVDKIEDNFSVLEQHIASTRKNVGLVQASLKEQQQLYQQQQELIRELVKKSREQKNVSAGLYEERILARLGEPFAVHRSDRIELKLFELKEEGYRGYAAKLKIFDPDAVEVVLARDTLGARETTSSAVKRTGAILGVNGGGFYETVEGNSVQIQPLGTTVVDGKIVGHFSPSHDNLFFAGFSHAGDLIGGTFYSEDRLMEKDPAAGVSFVPILLKDSAAMAIPEKWRHDRHPRTVISQYANGDILFVVIDGRQPNWSRGVSLEEMQIKLLQLGVVDAYNLDGGGSSTFVFEGKVYNRPSDGRERPVATNIVVYP